MKLPKQTRNISIALGLSVAILSPALAQEDKDVFELSPFSVTATDGYTATNTISGTGLNTPLINVPMSINVITSDFLEDSLIGDFVEALDYNASITQTQRGNAGNARPSPFAIRGFRNRNLLVDGVLGGVYLPPQMIDRIEVVKGPNTLYGQSDPGGLINVITKMPLAQEGGSVTAKAGSNEWRQIRLDYTVRAMDDKLGLRVMTDNKETNGWRWVDGQRTNFIGLSGRYKLGENTDFDFLTAKNKVNGFPSQRATWSFERIPTDLNGDGDFDDNVNGVNEKNTRYNNTFIPDEYVTSTKDNVFESDNDNLALGLRHSFSDRHTLQYKYNFNDTHQMVSFREFNTFDQFGESNSNMSRNDSRARDEVHTINDIIGFDTGEVKHQLLLGVRKSEDIRGGDGTYRLRAVNGAEAVKLRQLEADSGKTFRDYLYKDDIVNGVPIWEDDVASPAEIRSYGIRNNQNGRSYQDITTYYATDNIYFNEGKFNILLGVRKTEIDQRSTLLGGATNSTLKDSDTNFQLGGVYRINPNLSAFANIADAFEPQNRTDPDTGEFIGPQTSDAKEVGIKFDGLYDGKLSGSVALFNIQKNKVFRSDYNPVTFVNDQAITNDESEGIEFELFYNPTDNWNIVAAYSHISAQVVGDVATGLPLEGATPDRVTLFSSYTVQEGPLEGARFGGGLVWANGPIPQFGNIANRYVTEDGYTVFDFFARFPATIGGRDVTFGINIDNVTDEIFVRSRAATNEARQFIFSVSTDL
ncbi:MAG: TonB-dependent receptor [Opitutales bacterium]|jgi:iron complex outermembrane receptor protein|nr:TonB-dependent receptor [Opitutales bacterium]MBT6769403.1 TonB-dependent receptor [Opitutales bacterium]